MNLDVIIPSAITGVVGLLTGYLALKGQLGKTASDERDSFNKNLLTRLNDLEGKYQVQSQQIVAQSEEIIKLKTRNAFLENLVNEKFNHIAIMYSFYSKIPKPAWMKDKDGFMFFINDAFERQWGVSALRYDGQRDDNIWPKKIAEQFQKNDEEVKLRKKGLCFVEQIPQSPDSEDSEIEEWDVCRFPIVHQDELIGIGGIASKKGIKPKVPQRRRSTDD